MDVCAAVGIGRRAAGLRRGADGRQRRDTRVFARVIIHIMQLVRADLLYPPGRSLWRAIQGIVVATWACDLVDDIFLVTTGTDAWFAGASRPPKALSFSLVCPRPRRSAAGAAVEPWADLSRRVLLEKSRSDRAAQAGTLARCAIVNFVDLSIAIRRWNSHILNRRLARVEPTVFIGNF